MEYWSFGVMGEERTEEYTPCFRIYRDMIICSVKVIGQKQIQGGVSKLNNDQDIPGNFFFITPILQWFNSKTTARRVNHLILFGLGFIAYSCYASLRAMRRSSHWTPKERIIHMTRYMAVTVSHISMVT